MIRFNRWQKRQQRSGEQNKRNEIDLMKSISILRRFYPINDK